MRLRRASFTLLELLVVVTLMSVAVGMVVFRLDGVSDTTRLRSSATQIGSLLRLTQIQARTSGSPRLFEYVTDRDRVVVRAPQTQEDGWRWDEGLEYSIGTGVRIRRVLVEGNREMNRDSDAHRIRIGADGRCRAHAVVLAIHERWAVVVLAGLTEPRCVLLTRAPQAGSFELLVVELEHTSDAG